MKPRQKFCGCGWACGPTPEVVWVGAWTHGRNGVGGRGCAPEVSETHARSGAVVTPGVKWVGPWTHARSGVSGCVDPCQLLWPARQGEAVDLAPEMSVAWPEQSAPGGREGLSGRAGGQKGRAGYRVGRAGGLSGREWRSRAVRKPGDGKRDAFRPPSSTSIATPRRPGRQKFAQGSTRTRASPGCSRSFGWSYDPFAT